MLSSLRKLEVQLVIALMIRFFVQLEQNDPTRTVTYKSIAYAQIFIISVTLVQYWNVRFHLRRLFTHIHTRSLSLSMFVCVRVYKA